MNEDLIQFLEMGDEEAQAAPRSTKELDAESNAVDPFRLVKTGETEELKTVLEYNPKVVQQVDGQNRTLLHVATLYGLRDVMKMLIKARADVNAHEIEFNTPLHFAVGDENRLDCVSTLLDAGANPNCQNQYGDTPLHMAAEYGHAKVVKTLLKAGADPTIENNLMQDAEVVSDSAAVQQAFKQFHDGIDLDQETVIVNPIRRRMDRSLN